MKHGRAKVKACSSRKIWRSSGNTAARSVLTRDFANQRQFLVFAEAAPRDDVYGVGMGMDDQRHVGELIEYSWVLVVRSKLSVW